MTNAHSPKDYNEVYAGETLILHPEIMTSVSRDFRHSFALSSYTIALRPKREFERVQLLHIWTKFRRMLLEERLREDMTCNVLPCRMNSATSMDFGDGMLFIMLS